MFSELRWPQFTLGLEPARVRAMAYHREA
jgi:hypothetical protein